MKSGDNLKRVPIKWFAKIFNRNGLLRFQIEMDTGLKLFSDVAKFFKR